MNLSPEFVILLVAVLFVAALVNGVAGFGFATLAVGVLANLLGPKTGIVTMTLIVPPLISMQLIRNWQFRPVLRRLTTFLPAALVGSFIGVQLLVLLPGFVLSIALGIFGFWFLSNAARSEPMQIPAHAERVVAPGAGLLAGMLNGGLGASGPVVGSYLLAIGLKHREFVLAISATFFSMGLLRAGLLFSLGQYSWGLVLLAAVLFVPSALGQQTGFLLQNRLSKSAFQKVIVLLLLVASISLLVRGVIDGLAAMR
jgi:uncharacterized membrane protein YfcA